MANLGLGGGPLLNPMRGINPMKKPAIQHREMMILTFLLFIRVWYLKGLRMARYLSRVTATRLNMEVVHIWSRMLVDIKQRLKFSGRPIDVRMAAGIPIRPTRKSATASEMMYMLVADFLM